MPYRDGVVLEPRKEPTIPPMLPSRLPKMLLGEYLDDRVGVVRVAMHSATTCPDIFCCKWLLLWALERGVLS
ncbi:unknown [Tropheryma whipplei str. Twist]|uniref:Uncharacterized protein n=1 Tax=Tropheryma whipplei (strain Twist) TaxID=203267 RepID=Q83FU9_TROWT|nr:unknown [Tropheryma whipplei str. Twist]